VKNLYKKKKVKNVSEDGLGDTLGRVHVQVNNSDKTFRTNLNPTISYR
jgi:hypothetical protein